MNNFKLAGISMSKVVSALIKVEEEFKVFVVDSLRSMLLCEFDSTLPVMHNGAFMGTFQHRVYDNLKLKITVDCDWNGRNYISIKLYTE